MSFLNGFPRFFAGFPTFAFGFLLSATPFYFPRCFSAFRKNFFIFLKGFPNFLDGFPLSKKSEKIYLRWQVNKILLFELRNSLPLCSPSFIIATRSPSVIIATMSTSHPTKAIRMSRCNFRGINVSLANFTPMKKYFSQNNLSENNVSCLQNNLSENNVEPVPSKFELPPKSSAVLGRMANLK
jgi:hypothetical protein